MLFKNALSQITRETVDIDNARVVHSSNPKIPSMIKLIDGGGTELVQSKVVQRFAQYMSRGKPASTDMTVSTDTNSGEEYQAKLDQAKEAAIRQGLHTVVSLMLFSRINEIRASLFNAGSLYDYTPDGKTFEEDLTLSRTIAHHDRRMARLDMLGTTIGSAGMLVQGDALGYRYSPFDPSKAWMVFGETLTADDNRAMVDTLNLEHASIVVLLGDDRTDGDDLEKASYVAYFGRQDGYPSGRLVRYFATDWKNIPDPGDGGMDWVRSGEWTATPARDEIANPMTLYQEEAGQVSGVGALYEYPIFPWQADATADGSGIFPITGTALYDQCFELDVELSRDIESGGRSGAGQWTVSNPNGEVVAGVFNEGMFVAEKDQAVSLLSHSASNADVAMQMIDRLAERTAKRFHVPGYFVSSSEKFTIPSGFALEVMNLPLIWDRNRRAEINSAYMSRKFEIEKQLANFVSGETLIPLDAREKWHPKPLEFPKDKTTSAAWNDHRLKTGLASVADIAVELGSAETKEAADEMIQKNLEANASLNAGANGQQQRQGGTLGRLLGGQR
jgi:hypothetical protein